MIITVTLNPAIDFYTTIDSFIEAQTLSAKENYFYAGGKGINVSHVLQNLNFESKAVAFLGGFTGNFIEEEIREFIDPIMIRDRTRINTKIKTSSFETEIAGVAPKISEDEFKQLITKITSYKSADTIILSGSVPKSLPKNTYALIAAAVSPQIKVIVDTRGEALKESLEIPNLFFIKPNKDEIGELFNCKVQTNEQALELGLKLKKEYNIPYIVVSLGAEGAYFLAEDFVYFAEALKGKVISSVGAGDSLVAGFISAYIKSKDPLKAFSYAIACGAGTAFSHGLVTKKIADTLIHNVKVSKIIR
ncbi:MAG: 1-phosphofructokinase family hexose kinase [Brevinema sp.]